MMATSTLLGVEARLAKTDAMLMLTIVAAMGAMARAYLAARSGSGASPLDTAGGLLDRDRARHSDQGAADPDGRRRLRRSRCRSRIGLRALARWRCGRLRAVAGSRCRAALVHRHLCARRQLFLSTRSVTICWPRWTSAQETHGAPPGLYLLLFWVTFFPGSMLAGLAAPAVWACGETRREIPAGLAGAVLDRVRTGADQAAALCAAALSRDRHSDRGAIDSKVLSRRRWLVRGAMWWFIVAALISVAAVTVAIFVARDPGFSGWPFFAAAISAVCSPGCSTSRRRRTVHRPRNCGRRSDGGRCILDHRSVAADRVSERDARRHTAQRQLCPAGRGERRLPGAEPGVPRRHRDHLTDASSAADFLERGDCRFAFIETRQERAFVQRAEAIGLRYDRGPRIEGYNISTAAADQHRGLRIGGFAVNALSAPKSFALNNIIRCVRCPPAAPPRTRVPRAGRKHVRRNRGDADRHRGDRCSSLTSPQATGRARCRCGSSTFSSRSPISASPAGSCCRSGRADVSCRCERRDALSHATQNLLAMLACGSAFCSWRSACRDCSSPSSSA